VHTLARMIGDRVAEHCASNSMGSPILHGLLVGDDWCLCVEMHCCRALHSAERFSADIVRKSICVLMHASIWSVANVK
jgi:hypothetical protein